MRLFQGCVYRAHNPCWSFNVLSGDGAKRYGGRFNAKGVPALYTSLTPAVAFAEYQQGFSHRPQPTLLCAYEVDCEDILDLTNEGILRTYNIMQSDLSCAWEVLAQDKKPSPSWLLADALIERGVAGIIVPSFAKNAPYGGKNLVFWRWGETRPHKVTVYDDFSRLPTNQSSWE